MSKDIEQILNSNLSAAESESRVDKPNLHGKNNSSSNLGIKAHSLLRNCINTSEEFKQSVEHDSEGMINSHRENSFEGNGDVGSIVKDICEEHEFGVYFCMWIAVFHHSNNLEQAIKSFVKKIADKDLADRYLDDPLKTVERSQSILDRALEYAVQTCSPDIVEHLLHSAREHFLTAMVTDETILKLIRDIDSREKVKILSLLVNYEVLLHYSDVETNKFEAVVQELRQKSLPKKMTSSTKIILKETRKEADSQEDEKQDEVTDNSKNASKTQYEYNQIMPARLTSNHSYFDRKHIVEIALRSREFTPKQELRIVKKCFSRLSMIEEKDAMLIKWLVLYNEFELLWAIVDSKIADKTKREVADVDESLSYANKSMTFTQSTFMAEEVVWYALSYSIEIDKILFFQKTFYKYPSLVELQSFEILSLIFENMQYQCESGREITYIYEKLVILESITRNVDAYTALITNYIMIMKKIMKRDKSHNIFTSWPNPLRLFLMIVIAGNTFNSNVIRMTDNLMQVQEEAQTIVIEIINNTESPGVLRNWLLDDVDEGLKVIDYLAQLNLLEILNISTVVKVVDSIWIGKYDNSKTGGNLTKALKKSRLGTAFRKLNIPLDTLVSILSIKHWGAFFYYSVKLTYVMFSDGIKKLKASKETMFQKEELIQLPSYGYVQYMETIRCQLYLEAFGVFMMFSALIVCLITTANSRVDMISKYAAITTLQSQTQTTSVLSQIESAYSDLDQLGKEWFARFKGIFAICWMMMWLFIGDAMILLSLMVRRISIKLLSKVFLLVCLIDLVHTGLTIYLIDRYAIHYNITRSQYRSEEQYYRMMLSTEDGSLTAKGVFVYLVFVMVVRMLYQMVFFDKFANLVKIIFIMLLDCLKFLMLFVLFLLWYSVVGYFLFNDISEFGSFFYSLNTMYASALGGFDFAIYENSKLTTPTAGRLFLASYLIVAAILMLNFLIAILSDTYANNTKYTSALRMKEIINLRVIYESHEHYDCLVRAPLLINFYMVVMAPLVVIFKSKRLNKGMLHAEYLIIAFVYLLFLLINLILNVPVFVSIIVFVKLKNISKYSTSVIDSVLRFIDSFVVILWAPILCSIIYFCVLIGEAFGVYDTNILKVTEIHKEHYRDANNLMDASIHQECPLSFYESQIVYHRFKRIVSQNRSKIAYDPSNKMISEVVISILVATCKMVKRETILKLAHGQLDESLYVFVPTTYIVNEISQNMFVPDHWRGIIFGISSKMDDSSFSSERFEKLIEVLADRTQGGNNFNAQDEICIKDDGTNLVFKTACMKSHEHRKEFWRNKLTLLFSESNKQWLIDQFLLCKAFLYDNSFKTEFGNIEEAVWAANDDLQKLKSDILKRNVDDQPKGESWDENNNRSTTEEAKAQSQLVSVINVPILIDNYLTFEGKARDVYSFETDFGRTKMPKKTLKALTAENQIEVKRFVSIHLKSCYSAIASSEAKE